MKHPRRLVDEETDELMLGVLRSSEGEMPGREGRARTGMLLGIGVPSAAAGTVKLAAGVGAWKWAVMALAIGAALGGAAVLKSPQEAQVGGVASTPATAPSSEPPSERRSLPQAEPAVAAAIAPSPVVSAGPAPALAPVAPTRELKPANAKPAGSASLRAEVAALDQARMMLANGNPTGALARLDAHDREFDAPALAQEALMLRIEALVANGDRDSARAVMARLLATHPSTTYEDRARALVDPVE